MPKFTVTLDLTIKAPTIAAANGIGCTIAEHVLDTCNDTRNIDSLVGVIARAAGLPISTVLVISTMHLRQASFATMTSADYPIVAYPNEYGALVFVDAITENLSPDVAKVIEFARRLGLDWIRFDRDAAVIDALPVYAASWDYPSDDAVCDNCSKVWGVSDLADPKDLHQRLDYAPGDPRCVMPAGECPECGALAYAVKE